jgi:hypothetical protein
MSSKPPFDIGLQLKQAFNVEEMTPDQLWALTIFAKSVRKARNNAGFNAFMNVAFPEATFRQVLKSRPDRDDPDKDFRYEGLEITTKNSSFSVD